MDLDERYHRASRQFDLKDYLAAARTLEALLMDLAADPEGAGHGLTHVRLLLARAYYHSAQLGRAETAVRAVLSESPTDPYAALLLARTLERGSRVDEAREAMRVASALGAPGTSYDVGTPAA
jgi:Flp pilus assembly protein TadD